ncbi:hypothetical protein [Noviherbaspirillum aerium]|uniref:hypothetical protein n=1 Tax=Noviherbaspirillum aerium TaxID=2588497 RepID=UPI00178C50AE|nr:hypothetical protein [Noviherbaspirillum aerium]
MVNLIQKGNIIVVDSTACHQNRRDGRKGIKGLSFQGRQFSLHDANVAVVRGS